MISMTIRTSTKSEKVMMSIRSIELNRFGSRQCCQYFIVRVEPLWFTSTLTRMHNEDRMYKLSHKEKCKSVSENA
jgi:hypothetical protein